jgi:3-oxoacyl-[acyl-carrier-protein] synthase-3
MSDAPTDDLAPTSSSGGRVWRDPRSIAVLGCGAAMPGEAIGTAELLDRIEDRFEVKVKRRGAMLAERLGINFRHICRDFLSRRERPRPGDSNPEIAARAIKSALNAAGLAVNDLAYLIGHTATPANLIPSNIAMVADILRFRGPHLELRQACTGFANALVVAQGLLSAPGAGPIAIVGSETGSVYFDPDASVDDEQLVNLVQMGDGAAAIILAPACQSQRGVISHVFFGQIGVGRSPGLMTRAGGSSNPFIEEGWVRFEHDFRKVRSSGPELFSMGAMTAESMGVGIGSVDRLLPHQANGKMAELAECHFGFERRRVFVNADRVGNTGSAAIWIALHELRPEMKHGQRVLVLGAEATKFMFGGFHYVHG